MKIVLDLSKSINNYEYQNKEDLEGYIKMMLSSLDELYSKLEKQEDIEDTTLNRFYDILDMFSNYEIINENKISDAEKQKYIDIIENEYKPKIKELRDNLNDYYSISEYDSVYQDILDYEDNRYEDFETKIDFDKFIFYLKKLVK